MDLPPTSPPKSICLLRLSALGDICHTLPVVRTIQDHWPETRLTWIIGRSEHALIGDIPNVEFIIFDKERRWLAFRDLAHSLRGRQFDILLHMQMSLRASLISLLVKAPIKLGFDRLRAKDLQWLFSNRQIEHRSRQHVLDSLFGFTDALGLTHGKLRWDIPIPQSAHDFAAMVASDDRPLLIISPCSSHSYRNWSAAGYAAVANHAMGAHQMQVVLTGGQSEEEQRYGESISRAVEQPISNLIGKCSLKQLLAILGRATALISPDSGPAHMATAVGTPVVGLYAATNPQRARPYLSGDSVVDRYPEAVDSHYAKSPSQLPWGSRVRDGSAMSHITIDDVTTALDQLLAGGAGRPR